MICRLLLLAYCSTLGAVRAFGQAAEADADSLRTYTLSEIVVRDSERGALPPTTVQRVSLAAIAREDAAALPDLARLLPAVHVQTNSRGETLAYLRGAGERQVAFFFDGALLNVPWDNRIDLGFVPAGVVGGMTVAKGVPSVLYGPNVLGGAVNLTSRALGREGTFTEVAGWLGSPWAGQVYGTHFGGKGGFRYTGSAGYTARVGRALPAGADLPYNQAAGGVRTNTDRSLLNLYGRGSYRWAAGTEVGLSVLHMDGAQGVAPEGHLAPAASRVRFWRYPAWRGTLLVLNGTARVGGMQLRGAAWLSRFSQAIAQFRSGRYDTLQARQQDRDAAVGTRLVLLAPSGPGQLRLALNVLTAWHDQRELSFDEAGALLPAEAGDPGQAYPWRAYRQHVFSLGAEYDVQLAARLRALLGGSVDGVAMPGTADQLPRDPLVAAGITAGLVYDLAAGWALRASAGRKSRFPTMRELFDDALGRFLLNPDLRPEEALLAEAGVLVQRDNAGGEALFFLNRTYHTIDQQTVQVEGKPQRQRVNLDGSRVYGLEWVGAVRPWRRWSLEGHLTWMRARGLDAEGPRRLAEKPAWLGTLSLVHNRPDGLSFLLQPVLTAGAYALREDNTLERLPDALVLNVRVAYRLYRAGRRAVASTFFARVDNVTDAVLMPQLGLPGPGREFRAGLDISF